MGIDSASRTRLVEQLETQGLPGRRLDPADNRYTQTGLPPRRANSRRPRAHEQYQRRLPDGITAQQRQTALDALRRIRGNTTEQENS